VALACPRDGSTFRCVLQLAATEQLMDPQEFLLIDLVAAGMAHMIHLD
jgi:hypothetical protein